MMNWGGGGEPEICPAIASFDKYLKSTSTIHYSTKPPPKLTYPPTHPYYQNQQRAQSSEGEFFSRSQMDIEQSQIYPLYTLMRAKR